jgi:hypothetical protein
MNTTMVTLVRRPTLDEGNFGSEQPAHTEIRYQIRMNVNPVKPKPYNVSKEGIVTQYNYEVYTNPTLYPSFGTDRNGNRVDTKFDKVLPTDLIEFNGQTFSLSETFEDIAMNDQPLLWQHFFMKVIN